MDKILEALELVATERSNRYRDLANQMVMDLDGATEKEVAAYIALHDSDMRKVLGVTDLASREGNPELANKYFELRKRGMAQINPDPYVRRDVDNEEIKNIDYYLEKLGVPKKGGEYTDDIRSKYTNPENAEYVGKWNTDEINTYALADGQDPRFWKSDMERAARDYQQNNQARGYDANNHVSLGSWLLDAAQELGAPRAREARIMGKDLEARDVLGDLAEIGLNFVPGVGIVSKTGRVVARLPKALQYGARGVAGTVDYGAVPVGTQLYDMAAYGSDSTDPRGKWSTARVGSQAGGIAGTKFLLKGAGLGLGTKFASGVEGEAGAKGLRENVGGYIKDIGYKTDDAIAARQAELNYMAEQAKKRANVSLPGQPGISGTQYSPDDIINAENFQILTDEAKRLKRTMPARKAFNEEQAKAEQWYEGWKNSEREFGKTVEETYKIELDQYNQALEAMALEREAKKNAGTWTDADERRFNDLTTWRDESVARVKMARYMQKSDQIVTPGPLVGDGKYATQEQAAIGKQYSPDNFKTALTNFSDLNQKGTTPIVQLADGRFVKLSSVSDDGTKLNYGAQYTVPMPENSKGAVFQYADPDESSMLTSFIEQPQIDEFKAKIKPVAEPWKKYGYQGYVDRDQAVEAAIKTDPLLRRKYEGKWNSQAAETARDFVANTGSNMAAREGLVNNVVGYVDPAKQKMDEKRANALWNRQMNELRTKIIDKANSPKQRREYFDGIMDVLTYGLDSIPEDKFRLNPELYHAIADSLGAKEWKHWTEGEPAAASTQRMLEDN